MLPQATRTPKLAFGPFEYDPASGELRKHGYKVKLPSQPRQVLDALVARPGDLVAREDLRNSLWPGATAGDFEHGLNAASISSGKRLAMRNQPRYVETLPGLGYRFVAPTNRLRPAVLEFVPGAQHRTPVHSRRDAESRLGCRGGRAARASRRRLLDGPPPFACSVHAGDSVFGGSTKGYYLKAAVFASRSHSRRTAGGSRLRPKTRAAHSASSCATSRNWSPVRLSTARAHIPSSGLPTPDVAVYREGQAAPYGGKRGCKSDPLGRRPVLSSAIPLAGPPARLEPPQLGRDPSSGGTPQPINRVYSWAQMLPAGGTFSTPLTIRSSAPCVLASPPPVATIQVSRLSGPIPASNTLVRSTPMAGICLLACRSAPRAAIRSRQTPCHRGPRAIARHVPSFGPTWRCRLFGVATRRAGLPVFYQPLRSSSGWTGRANGFPPPALLRSAPPMCGSHPMAAGWPPCRSNIERGVPKSGCMTQSAEPAGSLSLDPTSQAHPSGHRTPAAWSIS